MRIGLAFTAIWFAFSVLAGVGYLAFAGAPLHYLAVNSGALAAALLLMRFAPELQSDRALDFVAMGAILVLFLPILFGPDVEGIRRWVGLGPVKLHSGLLVVPMLMALLPRLAKKRRLVVAALASIAMSLQPDRASALALLSGTGALFMTQRSLENMASLLFAAFALGATLIQPDLLETVRYVEHVLADAWASNPLIGSILAVSILAVLVLPALWKPNLVPALAAFGGFALASLFGPYPTPFIGYGAASIIGFGLAIVLVPRFMP